MFTLLTFNSFSCFSIWAKWSSPHHRENCFISKGPTSLPSMTSWTGRKPSRDSSRSLWSVTWTVLTSVSMRQLFSGAQGPTRYVAQMHVASGQHQRVCWFNTYVTVVKMLFRCLCQCAVKVVHRVHEWPPGKESLSAVLTASLVLTGRLATKVVRTSFHFAMTSKATEADRGHA